MNKSDNDDDIVLKYVAEDEWKSSKRYGSNLALRSSI